MKKKFVAVFCLIIVAFMVISIVASIPAAAVSFTPNFEVYSDAAYLVNLDTNTVIYEKNSDKRKYPASLTKVMTAILVLEHISDIDTTMITAPSSVFEELYLSGASTADFRKNEVASATDLMYGMLLQSACEAASILAYHVGGESVSNFVAMMNERAKSLGANNTNFENPHGLFSPNQHSTAKDMAIITRHAMSLPRFNDIVNTVKYSLSATNKHEEPRVVSHTNLMMDKINGGNHYYPYIKGIKTGTLDESGRCLVSSASKDGYNYLLVTLDAPMFDENVVKTFYHFIDAKNLYEWAFNDFKNTNILTTDEEFGEVKVRFSEGNDYVLVKPAKDFSTLWQSTVDLTTIQRVISLTEEVDAPVNKGDVLGTIELKLSGESLVITDLVAIDSLERSALKYNLNLAKQFVDSIWFKIAVTIVVVFIILYITLHITAVRKKRRNARHMRKRK